MDPLGPEQLMDVWTLPSPVAFAPRATPAQPHNVIPNLPEGWSMEWYLSLVITVTTYLGR